MRKKEKTEESKNRDMMIPEEKKAKKPFYKRGWIIVLVAVILIVAIASNGNDYDKNVRIKWADLVLGDMLPEVKSPVGKIWSNSEEALSLDLAKFSPADYTDYLSRCESMGYDVDPARKESSYRAYNDDGYKLELSYNDYEKELSLKLNVPIKMGPLQWPQSEIAKLLPVPKSTVGKVQWEYDSGFALYVGETPLEDYQQYVSDCMDRGFTVDYNKGDDFFYGDNAEDYHISLSYEGNNIMRIEIQEPSHYGTDTAQENPPEEAEEPEPEAQPETDTSTNANSTPATGTDDASELVNGMHPEFKEAMDSYEKFFDDYCAFMKKYSESDNTASLLADYGKFMAQYSVTMKKLDDLSDQDMNDAETQYYLETMNRINQKLLSVAS